MAGALTVIAPYAGRFARPFVSPVAGSRVPEHHLRRKRARCESAASAYLQAKTANGSAKVAIKDSERWMWSEACEMLLRAERLHRQLFQPAVGRHQAPAWEPPADVLETEGHVVIYVALPGVHQDHVELALDGGELVIAGMRVLPHELRNALIHRLELPQGRFERRIALPPGRYNQIAKNSIDGCLVITLRKSA
jgi:HSP20 family protein